MKKEKALPWSVRLGYGLGSMGDACTYTVVGTFLMFFLTTVAGISPVMAGTIAAVGAVWNAVCSPIIGFISDNSKSKYGRRLPFIFFAAFPLGISCAMLFSSIDATGTIKVIYYGLMVLIFWTSFSFYFVPYMALGAEVTGEYHERTVLRSVTYGFSLVGMVMGMVVPTIIVDLLMSKSFSVEKAWATTGILIGIISIICVIYSCFSLMETVKEYNFKTQKDVILRSKQEKKSTVIMIKEYWQVLKIKPTKFILFASICYLTANTMNYSDRIYFMTYILKLDAKVITLVMFSAIVSGAIFIPIITRASKKFDKRSVYIVCMGIGASWAMFSRVIGIESLPAMVLFLFLFACGNSAYWQLIPAMIYDVCEIDEAVNGARREGSVISLQALSEAVASAISMQLLGIILESAKFNGEATVQTELTNIWIENAFSLIPGIFMAISVFMVFKYPITKSRFEKVQKELETKRNGGKINFDNIKDLI